MNNPYKNIPSPIWVLCLISLMSKSGIAVLAFFPLYLTDNLNLAFNTIGHIFSLGGLGCMIGSYMGGYLSDRFGSVSVQAGSMMVEGSCFMFLGYLHSLSALLILIFLIGLSNAAAKSAAYSNLAAYSQEHAYAFSYALNNQAISVGAIFGLIISGSLAISKYSWLFAMNGAANFIACIILIKCLYNQKPLGIKPSLNHKFILPRINKYFLILMILVTLMGMCMMLDDAFTLYLKKNEHISQSKIGNIFELQLVFGIVLQVPITNYFKRFNELYVMGLGILLVALGYFILPISIGFYSAITCITLVTLGELVTTPMLYAYVTRIAPEKNKGSYLGLTNCAFISFPLILTPTLSLLIYTAFKPDVLWLGTSLLAMMICTSFLVFQRYRLINIVNE